MATFPVAIWGRPDTWVPGKLRGYQIISKSEQFSKHAQDELELLVRTVQWESQSTEKLPDAYLAWPFSEGTLLAKISDAGIDEHDRPHAMRIICALVPRSIDPTWLLPEAWPHTVHVSETITLHDSSDPKHVIQRIMVNDPSGALRVSHVDHIATSRSDRAGIQPPPEQDKLVVPTTSRYAFLPVILTFLALAAFIAWREMTFFQNVGQLKDDHKKEMKSKEIEWKKSQEDLEWAVSKLKAEKEKLDACSRRIQQLEEENQKLTAWKSQLSTVDRSQLNQKELMQSNKKARQERDRLLRDFEDIKERIDKLILELKGSSSQDQYPQKGQPK